MVRAGGEADWRRDWTLPFGVIAGAGAAAGFQFYRVWDDPDHPQSLLSRANPSAGFELRWPWARTSPGGAMHVIEPVAQVVYSDTIGDADVPNEDSQLPEFDASNLFALNRFPGLDRIETGLRANLGIKYTRFDPAGWSMGFALGRVVRNEPDPQFSEGTGLAGKWSDFVGTLTLDFASGLKLQNRSLFNTDFFFKRNEFAMAYDTGQSGFETSYVFLAEDDSRSVLGPQPKTSEFGIDAHYRVHPNWEVRGRWRYDAAARKSLRAEAGVIYGNQCVEIDLKVSRRFTSSTNVPQSTSYGFNVRLAGIGGTGERDWPARTCIAGGA